jgi:[acyl-carrier-protein] S-malonyltransferase
MICFPFVRTCFLFPGQGAQYPGMAKDLWDNSPRVKELFRAASASAGTDMESLLFSSTAEELQATDRAQIAILLADLASAEALRDRGMQPEACAGFSLGEYAALCVAGVLRVEDVFSIVRVRGSLMESASRAWDSETGKSGMTAVLGLSPEKVESVLSGLEGVFVANRNSPTQTVISGSAEGLAKAEAALAPAGAKRVIRLKVSGPFHSPLMAKAAGEFAEILARHAFSDPKIPVYSNAIAERIRGGSDARDLCVRHMVSAVRWVEEERALLADGCSLFLETGPGSVLCGLLRGLDPAARCMPAGTWDGVVKAVPAA